MLASRTYIAIPPGQTILEQLEYHGISKDDFTDKMNMDHEEAERLIHGQMILSREIASKLEKALGPPARFWLNMEAIYREDLEKVQLENARNHSTSISSVQAVREKPLTTRAQA